MFRDGRFRSRLESIEPQTTVGEIVDSLNISREEIGVMMLNSRLTTFDATPAEGDALALFPVIGGG